VAAARRLPEGERAVRDGAWRTWEPQGFLGIELRGATLAVIGAGRIGRAVCERAEAFGIDVLLVRRRDRSTPPCSAPTSSRCTRRSRRRPGGASTRSRSRDEADRDPGQHRARALVDIDALTRGARGRHDSPPRRST
jgi:hypothetical protein